MEETDEVWLSFGENFKVNDFIEVSHVDSSEILIVQLPATFHKPSTVEKKKTISLVKGLMDTHPFLKSNA
jgi:hypothetical protein